MDVERYPLDVVVVSRAAGKPADFFVDDARYQQTARGYTLLRGSCVVCDERGSIMAVFVTATAIPSLDAVARQARLRSGGEA